MKILNRVAISSVVSSVVLLGSSPNINLPNSSTIDRQLRAPIDLPTKKEESIKIESGEEQDSLSLDDSSQTIFIKSFKIEGNTVISSDEILNSIKEYENRDLTFKELQALALKISKLYHDKGYFVARAYLPSQNIEENDNVLIISVLEGLYGEFNINNSSLVKDSVIQDIFDNAKFGKIIDSKRVDRAILLVNDRFGVKVSKAQLSPGEEVGSSNFNIETVSTNRVDGYVVADNYGSRYTGEYRLQGLVNVKSIFGVGDGLTLSGLVSNGADLKNGRLAYELPLNSYGLRADIAYTRTNYDLVKEYEDLDAKGNSNIYEIGLSYPLYLTSDDKLYLRGKYFHKNLNDYMFDEKYQEKYINSFVASLDYVKNYYLGNLPARFSGTLNLTTGHLNSKDSKLNDGRYNKIDTSLSNEIAFSQIFSLNTKLQAQKVLGHKNLDGSEDLSLGGAYDVRVYPDSQQSGSNGYIVNLEFLTQLPNISSYTHQVGLFYDIGDVYQEIQRDSTFERERLKDVGVGYYSNYKDFFARVQMAWTANSTPITSEKTEHPNYKILFQTGIVF